MPDDYETVADSPVDISRLPLNADGTLSLIIGIPLGVGERMAFKGYALSFHDFADIHRILDGKPSVDLR